MLIYFLCPPPQLIYNENTYYIIMISILLQVVNYPMEIELLLCVVHDGTLLALK